MHLSVPISAPKGCFYRVAGNFLVLLVVVDSRNRCYVFLFLMSVPGGVATNF